MPNSVILGQTVRA